MSADGAWKITVNSPIGPQEIDATIVTSGDTFTGQTSGKLGDQQIAGKITGGDTLVWSADITQPMPLTLEFEAKVEGDAMSGNVKFGVFGSGSLSGRRA